MNIRPKTKEVPSHKYIVEKYGISMKFYQQVHYWLKKNFGKASKCESKACKSPLGRYEWALIHGKQYACIRENFWQLCKSCHIRLDMTEDGKQRMSQFRTGRKQDREFVERRAASNRGNIYIRKDIKAFITKALEDERESFKKLVEEKIQTAKARKRMTPFQDTLFNYEVNVLTDLLDSLT